MTSYSSFNRRSALGAITLTVTSLSLPAVLRADTAKAVGAMHVAKSPACGCCEAWVRIAIAQGYDVTMTDMGDVTPAKIQAGVPQSLWSCHTATVEGYVIEGHVPFEAVAKLLRERPMITGLSVPGMPMGSPGMGDDPTARFDVIAFGGDAAEGQVYFEAGA